MVEQVLVCCSWLRTLCRPPIPGRARRNACRRPRTPRSDNRVSPSRPGDIAKHLEVGIEGDIDHAPDEQIGIGKCDVQASDRLGHATMLTGALLTVQFQGMSSSQREAGQPEEIFPMTSAT